MLKKAIPERATVELLKKNIRAFLNEELNTCSSGLPFFQIAAILGMTPEHEAAFRKKNSSKVIS